MVMGDDSDREVVGSNPGTIHWMELTFFALICCKNCIVVCSKRPKINKKEARLAHLKKTSYTTCNIHLMCFISA